MPEFPERLSVGTPDRPVIYELVRDQVLIRMSSGSDEKGLASFLSKEGLEPPQPPEHIRRAEATLRGAGLRWITLRQRFPTIADADTLLDERADIADVLPVYYLTGGGPETAATPIFDTLLVKIDDDRRKETLAALTALGLERNEPMSSLLAPTQVFKVPVGAGQTAAERGQTLAQKAAALPGVLSVEFDWLKLETYQLIPNDPFYTNQWNMQQIGAEGAWGMELGNANIWIAIIDSGFDLAHPDINYTPNSGGTLTHFNADEFLNGDPPPYDAGPSGVPHGTAVAGISGATATNSQGVAGIAGGCQIMPVRLGTIPTSARVAAGINWAANNGAQVANLSLTTTATVAATDAVVNAWTAGMLLCAATGNGGGNITSPLIGFPANHPTVMAVGASDRNDERKRPARTDGECWGSQFGNEIDVVAPGVNIWTTDEQANNGYNNNNGGPLNWSCVNYASSGDVTGNYVALFNGTSAATPHVTGLAALILSANPALSNQQVRNILESTCDKVSSGLYPYAVVAGRENGTWHEEMGYGRINAVRALTVARAGALIFLNVI